MRERKPNRYIQAGPYTWVEITPELQEFMAQEDKKSFTRFLVLGLWLPAAVAGIILLTCILLRWS